MVKASLLEELNREHEMLLQKAQRLQQALADLNSVQEGGAAPPSAEGVYALLELLRADLLTHFRREEALFSAARLAVAVADKTTEELVAFLTGEGESDLAAHTVIGNRMNEVLALVKESRATGAPESVALRRLSAPVAVTLDIVRRHAADEDRIIFPIIGHVLRSEQIAEVWKGLQPSSKEKCAAQNP